MPMIIIIVFWIGRSLVKSLLWKGSLPNTVHKQILAIFSVVETDAEMICDLPQVQVPELGLVLDPNGHKAFFLFAISHRILSLFSK